MFTLTFEHSLKCNDEPPLVFKVLDVHAAFACVESLEPSAMDTYAQKQAWLRRVKKLQVPIELICSEDSVRQYGERSKTIIHRVQLVKLTQLFSDFSNGPCCTC